MRSLVVGDASGRGLCAVLASAQLGADVVIAMSITRIVNVSRPRSAPPISISSPESGEDGIAAVKELTNGIGADCVLKCVGTEEARLQELVVCATLEHRADGRPARRATSQRAVLGPTSESTVDPHIAGPICLICSTSCCPARSTPGWSSTSRFRSTRSPRVMRRWMNAERSRPCCALTSRASHRASVTKVAGPDSARED